VDQPDIEETNDLMCIVLRKDGDVSRMPNGRIERRDRLPRNGDGYFVGSLGCTVIGHVYTPLLPYTWHLFLTEN
jgi:hypothetical protein